MENAVAALEARLETVETSQHQSLWVLTTRVDEIEERAADTAQRTINGTEDALIALQTRLGNFEALQRALTDHVRELEARVVTTQRDIDELGPVRQWWGSYA
jgi:predicted  nucleic acid-binding Zn-ribbon protein